MADFIEDYVNSRHKLQYTDGPYANSLSEGLSVDIDAPYIIDTDKPMKPIMASSEAAEKDNSLSEDELLDVSTPAGKEWAKSSRAIYNRWHGGSEGMMPLDTPSMTQTDVSQPVDPATSPEVSDERLRADPTFRDVTLPREAYGNGIKRPETDQDFARWGVEFMGQFNYNMTKMAVDYSKLRGMDEQTALNFYNLMYTYDKLPMFTWNGTKRMFKGLATDPTTYAGLGTLGLSFIGRAGSKQMTKKGFQEALKRKIQNPYVIAAIEGGAYSGLDDALRQGVEIEAKVREGIDPLQTAGQAAVGAAAGTGLVGAIDVAPTVARAVGDRLSQPGEMPTVGANFANIPSVPFANLRERYSRVLREAADGKDPNKIKLTPDRMEKAKQIATREFDPSIFASKEDYENFKEEMKLPTKQMVAAKEFVSLALASDEKVKLRMPDGERGSIYVKVGDKGTVRFADHAQPTKFDDKNKIVPVGGFSTKLNRRHGAATLSVDPETNISVQDAFKSFFSKPGRIATRFPTAVKATEDPLGQPLTVGLDDLKQDARLYDFNVNITKDYPNMVEVQEETTDQTAERFVDHLKNNLLYLHDMVPPTTRIRSQKWYDGANKIANDFVQKYNVPDTSVAGAIAALSPQKDWYQNVALAEKTLDVAINKKDFVFSDEMAATFDNIPAFQKPLYKSMRDVLRGKTYSQLSDPDRKVDLGLKAMFVRLYDQTYNTPDYKIVSPEGEFLETAKNIDGSNSKAAWGSLNEISKAIESIEADGDVKIISKAMGERHKVRNFYNNIYDPNSPIGDVTIDTHAVAAGLLRPLSGNSLEVDHNFKNQTVKGRGTTKGSAVSGINGNYALYVEAYRRAAAERGILPRQMQSITWEAVRGFFPDTFKANEKNVIDVDAIWSRYKSGEIDLDETRRLVNERSGGYKPPTWE